MPDAHVVGRSAVAILSFTATGLSANQRGDLGFGSEETSATIKWSSIYGQIGGLSEPFDFPATSPERSLSATDPSCACSCSCSVLEMKTFCGDVLMWGLSFLKAAFVARAARGRCTSTIC